jgi:CheY-like chemotaxis protein
MPGINGFEMIERIRANPDFRRLPVVVVTSNEDVASIDRAYRAGATSFVTKPVNWRLLSYQLRYVLSAQKHLAP